MVKKKYPADFERLWKEHPTKQGKGAALKAFNKLKITADDVDEIILKIKKYAKLCQHEQREQRYIRSLGPWLNNCLDDEIEVPETPADRREREQKEMIERRERLSAK